VRSELTDTHLRGPDLDDVELDRLSRSFEHAPAGAVIEWAVDTFHPHLCLTASMTDAVLIDLAVSVEPSIEVVFIDTRYHFPETLETVEAVRRRYGLDLRIMTEPTPTTAVRRPRCPSWTVP
jgi:phosphoadenosine phosphosulfate reductase